jgi:2-polyprenyl-3-methyl-5-hydroxy-6-metoxy-1,4-benzoquinol methylase
MLGQEKLSYFASSLARALAKRGFECPSCGGRAGATVSRKYMVTWLRRCGDCGLQFRAPASPAAEDERYYDTQYESGFTTEMPDAPTLASYLQSNFVGTSKDFARYLKLLSALGAGAGQRVLDLGCSWGYGVWQLRAAGYDAFGLEVGKTRARFARERLALPVVSRLEEVEGQFDVIFSSHVLEHIAHLAPTLSFARARLRENGLFVAITPNGSDSFRARSPRQWDRLWGLKHPLFLDAEYWRRELDSAPYLLTTDLGDLDAMSRWSSSGGQVVARLDGWELLAASRKWPGRKDR